MARNKANFKSPIGQEQQEAALRAFGQILQRQREEQQLTMRQLALDTRVSTAVVEALEKGWLQRLPETAFLGTILQKLAERLALPKEDMEALIKEALPPIPKNNRNAEAALTGFTLGSIDLFSTWQGTIAYLALVLALIYGLNSQHRQLVKAGSFSTHPIAPKAHPEKLEQANRHLLKLYPELRPLP